MLQTILLVVLAGIGAWFVVGMFPRIERSGTSAYKNSPPASHFPAVSVHPSPAGCQAAKALKSKRFLSDEAPRLPLEGCEAAVCHCIYHHHSDRRSGNRDRRALGGDRFSPLSDSNANRRSSAGRRELDGNSDLSWT